MLRALSLLGLVYFMSYSISCVGTEQKECSDGVPFYFGESCERDGDCGDYICRDVYVDSVSHKWCTQTCATDNDCPVSYTEEKQYSSKCSGHLCAPIDCSAAD